MWNEMRSSLQFPRHSVSLFSSGVHWAVCPNAPFPGQLVYTRRTLLAWSSSCLVAGCPSISPLQAGCELLHFNGRGLNRVTLMFMGCWLMVRQPAGVQVFLHLSGRGPPAHHRSLRCYFIICPQATGTIVYTHAYTHICIPQYFLLPRKRNSFIFPSPFCFDIKADRTSQIGEWKQKNMRLKNVLWQLICPLCNVSGTLWNLGRGSSLGLMSP